ncbi:MAG: phosphatase PAP2 family protein [Actinomycetota bacterium]
MWIYSSQLTIFLVSAVTLVLLVWMATGRNPVGELRSTIRFFRWDARLLGALVAAVAMFVVDSIETYLEPWIGNHVTWDFTQQVGHAGLNLLLAIQRLEWPPLTHVMTFVYVIAFPLLMLSGLVVYSARDDWEAVKRLLTGYYLNYLVALPFYIFVPVKEAWAGNRGIHFLIPQIYPGFETQYRPYSGLDNCFPSLHTSLALTYALVAWRCGYRRLAIVLTIGAGLVMFSTLYLGIHWIPDMLAGAALAVLASGVLPAIAPATAQELPSER